MWMRSCAVCKALLRKLRLCDSVRCHCGWIWWAIGVENRLQLRPQKLYGGAGSERHPSFLTAAVQ